MSADWTWIVSFSYARVFCPFVGLERGEQAMTEWRISDFFRFDFVLIFDYGENEVCSLVFGVCCWEITILKTYKQHNIKLHNVTNYNL